MHVSQIVAVTASLIGVIIGLVYFLRGSSKDASFLKSSTWTITIPEESVSQTWYIDTEANALKIVQHKTNQSAFAVQEMHSGKIFDYTMWDRIDSTVPSSACDGVEFTDDMDCDSYIALLQKDIDESVEVKGDCVVEDLGVENLETYSLSAEIGEDETLMMGGFLIQLAGGIPSAILDNDDESVIATIDSIEDGIPADVTFEGCDVDGSRRAEMDISERRLGWQETLSNTDWCGAGTNIETTPCPSQRTKGNLKDNQCCRRHDHGTEHESAAGGFGVKLECTNDHDLATCSGNWAIQAAFGKYGVAQTWGCLTYGKHNDCRWTWPCSCGWRGCSCSGKVRACDRKNTNSWKTNYGWERYDYYKDRGDANTYKDPAGGCPASDNLW